MKTLYCSVTLVFLVFATTTEHAEAQQGNAQDVKTAVRMAWDTYIDAFSAGRTDLVASDIYAAPSYQLGENGGTVRMRVSDIKAAFDDIHASLNEARYARSETDVATICVINLGTALLSAHFTRYRDDGTVLTRGASSYLFAKFKSDWRIVAIMGNPSGNLIACD